MKTISLNVPNTGTLLTFDYSMYLAAKLYEDGILSSGQASSMVNLSKRSFIELMGKYNVSVFSTSIEDLKEDIANA
jgi:predicted HTH domain antitoxin